MLKNILIFKKKKWIFFAKETREKIYYEIRCKQRVICISYYKYILYIDLYNCIVISNKEQSINII